MAGGKKLHERVALGRTAWMLADFVILLLLLALVARRAASLGERGGTLEELPAVDMFVTTADPALEPPLITVNTVLSLLALDYPDVGKLACYVSDDGCSPVTCYALREAAKFASLWIPFCKRYDIGVRAPFMYFSSAPEVGTGTADHEFLESWALMKTEYEKLASRIENADEVSILRDGGEEFAEFIDAERGNHPTIVKVLWDNSKSKAGEGFPHLVYLSREKSPRHRHNFKAGAMNVLTRVSAVMTNAPIMLNVDCDMFANNPQVALHAMCLLLGFDDEIHSGFVQAPQKFYGGLKDDPFGNQMQVITKKIGGGLAGIQGTFYGGTGCFHRRKVIYGMPPPDTVKHETRGSPSYKELQAKFGSSKELIESSRNIISGDLLARPTVDISSRVEMAKQVGDCNYEAGTCWGQEASDEGFHIPAALFLTYNIYHLMEYKECGLSVRAWWNNHRMQRITSASAWLLAFLTVILKTLGLSETVFEVTRKESSTSSDGGAGTDDADPGLFTFDSAPVFIPVTALSVLNIVALTVAAWRAVVGTVAGVHGGPGVGEFMCCGWMVLCFWPFVRGLVSSGKFSHPSGSILDLQHIPRDGVQEVRALIPCWWNNHRMQRITSASAWLLAFLTVILKTLGLFETVLEVTRKERSTSDGGVGTDEADPGLFTFDSAPDFIPVMALSMLNISALTFTECR
ncbi:Cellulose synthase-like protein H1 [Triticum urartu]|uniref:Cellulose synthase-like protein H1 n=1 Tax=Triticum urartu TaxID=4572 RepID=M7Z6X1_TRIUA|nr:Cellulose synthase-like protein H1 [Triticum urartu]